MISTTKKLITSEDIKQLLPVSERLAVLRKEKINQIKQIIVKEDKRLLLILGPCSADNEQAFYQYLSLLKSLEREVSDKIMIIPRLYTAKPRSKGDTYKGIMFSESADSPAINLEKGLITSRRMFITALSEYGFVCADELLHTDTYGYFDDIAAYAVVGARNAESQQHRCLASGLDIPVAFKNPTNGNLQSLCNAVYTAQRKNVFIYNGHQAETTGNVFSHAILRGGVDKQGKHFSNYQMDELSRLKENFLSAKIQNPAFLIDVNHSNSAKNYLRQSEIVIETFQKIKDCPEIRSIFAGYMIESYIKDGAAGTDKAEFGMSVTDACLGFEKTRLLIENLYNMI